jgi:hypothetical protein
MSNHDFNFPVVVGQRHVNSATLTLVKCGECGGKVACRLWRDLYTFMRIAWSR